MKRLLKIALPAVAVIALAAFSSSVVSQNDGVTQSELQPPKRVWICHGPGHIINNLEGMPQEPRDWVIEYPADNQGIPKPDQVTFCARRGGDLIEVSARAAVRGHKAQLINDRISRYPPRR